MTTATVRPPIPAGLAHRPTIGGIAAPWVNVALADGGCDFRVVHQSKWERAWLQGICQTCGLRLDRRPVVLLGGPNQLAGYFTEPPLHPWCAAYAQRACPMVAGRADTYSAAPAVSEGRRGASCPEPGCNCGGWVPHNPASPGHPGEPAHEWWAVWCMDWAIVASPKGDLLGGKPVGERRRRLVSTPTAGAA